MFAQINPDLYQPQVNYFNLIKEGSYFYTSSHHSYLNGEAFQNDP